MVAAPGFSPFIMLPTLFGVLGHIGFCFLLLDKWESLELANDGQPIPFANMTTFTALPDAGIPWWLVFTPSWAAEVGTGVVILASLASSRIAHSRTWKLLQCAALRLQPIGTQTPRGPSRACCNLKGSEGGVGVHLASPAVASVLATSASRA